MTCGASNSVSESSHALVNTMQKYVDLLLVQADLEWFVRAREIMSLVTVTRPR